MDKGDTLTISTCLSLFCALILFAVLYILYLKQFLITRSHQKGGLIAIDEKKPIITRITRWHSEIFTRKEVGVYARVSTARAKQTQSIDSQVGFLVDSVTSNYDQILCGIYVDIGSGRRADTRTELKRLIGDCKSGKIDMIITKSVSRFGRNTANTLTICRDLATHNVDVYFYNEDIHSLSR